MTTRADQRFVWFALLSLVLSFGSSAIAQQEPSARQADLATWLPPLFTSVGDSESVPEGVVTGLAEDGEGLMWIGTSHGLVRYDGHRLRLYRTDAEDDRSLPGNFVRCLLASREGRIWVGFEAGGVARYDATSDGFEHYGIAAGVPDLPIRALAEDADGALWIGTTGGGLARLDPRGGSATVLAHRLDDPSSLPDDRVTALRVDRDGTLWVGTWRGLARRLVGSDRFERVLSAPGDALGFGDTSIRAIEQASNGDLWVGAQQGQMAVIPTALLSRAEPPGPNEVRRWIGRGMAAAAEPRAGEIWLAQPGGIEVRALDDARLLRTIEPMPGEPFGLTAADVRELLVDRSGLLWLGSFGGGVQLTDPRPPGFVNRRLVPGIDPPLPALNVLTMSDASDGGAWIGLAGGGVAKLTPALRVVALTTPAQGAFQGDQPSGLAETADRALWMGTEQGLFRRGPGQLRFAPVAAVGFAEAASIRKLWPDGRSGVWIGTSDGLFHVDRDSSGLFRVPLADGGEAGGAFKAMSRAPDGRWWVAGSEGLMRLDAEEQQLQRVVTTVDGSVRKLDVNGLLWDRKGRLWLDASGPFRVTPNADGSAALQAVSAPQSPGGRIFGTANLLDDAQGRIWTQRTVFDPTSGALETLEGVRVGTGWFRSFARLAGGRLAFGGREGVLVVDPKAFRPSGRAPPIVITDVRIDGTRAAAGAGARRITLAPGMRGFSIEFAALDYAAPRLNRYRYRLNGVDADWVEPTDDSRTASYGNLWPGSYRFEVQAARQGGAWYPDGRVLEVEVEPRWWQTQLAAVLALLITMLAATVVVRWRTRALRAAGRALETEVERRTSDLRVLSEALARKTREFEEASLTDPLTGLRNRRFIASELDAATSQWSRQRSALERRDLLLLLIDIDHFKTVNDQRGHAAGDELLRQLAARLSALFRAGDHVVRWGGEEFLVVARHADEIFAGDIAERIRDALSMAPYELPGGPLDVTCSIGFAPLPWDLARPTAVHWEGVLALADSALYTVKQGGRNGWLGLLPVAPLPLGADLAWLLQRLPRLVTNGDVRLASNLDVDVMAHLLAQQIR